MLCDPWVVSGPRVATNLWVVSGPAVCSENRTTFSSAKDEFELTEFTAVQTYKPPSFNVTFRMVSCASCMTVLDSGRDPSDLLHVISGCGSPVALHMKYTLFPSAVTMLLGCTATEGATKERSRVRAQLKIALDKN